MEQVPVFRFMAVATQMGVVRGALIVAALAGCRASSRSSSRDSTIGAESTTAVVRDDFGTPISIAHPPRRIVSLNPTTTEILVALGDKPRLVGRSQYDTFPDSVKSVASVGPALRPSVESILAVHPDLVLLYASEDNRPAYDRLRAAGITTFAFKIDSIAAFDRDTRTLGRLTGDTIAARIMVDTVSASLARVRAATASLPRPTVFYPTWDKPIIAIGGGSFMSQLFEIAGGRNIYASIPTPSVAVAIEDVVQRNPDFVITSRSFADKMRTNAMWQAVPAVRAGHVLVVDEDIVTRPSVQLGTAAVVLARLIHPGAVR